MLERSSIYIITEEDEIFRLEINLETQQEITKAFEKEKDEYLKLEPVKFDGIYKLESDEVFYIQDFDMQENIKEAIKFEAGVEKAKISNLNLKAIMLGKYDKKKDEYNIVFQNFRKSQYITSLGKFNLIYDKDTFVLDKRDGISILDSIDCLYVNNKLLFKSFFYTKGIFDLTKYYREATDCEVKTFISDEKIDFGSEENEKNFLTTANATIRKLIASLNDSGVLRKYNIEQIRNKAKKFKIDMQVKNNKILIPNDTVKIKEMLRFLNDDIYRGVLSDVEFVSNSKQKRISKF